MVGAVGGGLHESLFSLAMACGGDDLPGRRPQHRPGAGTVAGRVWHSAARSRSAAERHTAAGGRRADRASAAGGDRSAAAPAMRAPTSMRARERLGLYRARRVPARLQPPGASLPKLRLRGEAAAHLPRAHTQAAARCHAKAPARHCGSALSRRKEEVIMRILSIRPYLLLTALSVATITAGGPASVAVAGNRTTVAPNRDCMWRGTAPFCKGECEPGEVRWATASSPEGAKPDELGFGATCASGRKFLCCKLWCPSDQWELIGNECVLQMPESEGPIEAPGPTEAIERKKGPIEAPSPIEGTELSKGPVIETPVEPYATKRNPGPMIKD